MSYPVSFRKHYESMGPSPVTSNLGAGAIITFVALTIFACSAVKNAGFSNSSIVAVVTAGVVGTALAITYFQQAISSFRIYYV